MSPTPTTAGEPLAEDLFTDQGLTVGECAACGALSFPRRMVCPECQGSEIGERTLTGGGTIFTFTIVRMSPPGYLGEAPYAIGVIELDEGLRITATILADELESLAIGARVEFATHELVGGEAPVRSFAYRRKGA